MEEKHSSQDVALLMVIGYCHSFCSGSDIIFQGLSLIAQDIRNGVESSEVGLHHD